jgi:hypothetical protein
MRTCPRLSTASFEVSQGIVFASFNLKGEVEGELVRNVDVFLGGIMKE